MFVIFVTICLCERIYLFNVNFVRINKLVILCKKEQFINKSEKPNSRTKQPYYKPKLSTKSPTKQPITSLQNQSIRLMTSQSV